MIEWIEDRIELLEEKIQVLHDEYDFHAMPVEIEKKVDALTDEIIILGKCDRLRFHFYGQQTKNAPYLYNYKIAGSGSTTISVPCMTTDLTPKLWSLSAKGHFFKI